MYLNALVQRNVGRSFVRPRVNLPWPMLVRAWTSREDPKGVILGERVERDATEETGGEAALKLEHDCSDMLFIKLVA